MVFAIGFSTAFVHESFAQEIEVVTGAEVVRQAEGTPPSNPWVFFHRNAGDGDFRVGPEGPELLGLGSFQLTTPTGADKAYLFNYDHVGTPLRDINKIRYSTYRSSGSLQQVTAINIEIDINGGALNPGEYSVLVFEPVYNTSQGSVISGQWQPWDAYSNGNAIWWSSRAIPGVCAFSCYVTWNQIIAANPNATIVGGFGINQGSGNPELVTATDALSIGYSVDSVNDWTTYDFEPYRVATSRESCKVGGWKNYRRADGTEFKNQGDCVSYVNTGN